MQKFCKKTKKLYDKYFLCTNLKEVDLADTLDSFASNHPPPGRPPRSPLNSSLEGVSSDLLFIRLDPTSASCRAMLAGHSKPLDRECFISTGATADFPKLVKAALAADFLEALQELGYTRLTLQVGNLLPYFHDIKPKVSEARGLDITAFDFNKAGLGAEMMKVKEARGRRKQGVVISHAGKLHSSVLFKTIWTYTIMKVLVLSWMP